MPRPRSVHRHAIVDADVCARAGTLIERTFDAADLPRLTEAGVRPSAPIAVRLQFSIFDGHPVIEGELKGEVVGACQRCMQPAPVQLNERFQVLVTLQERSDEPGGYEPIIADPARLDLGWLVEEEALLALPLVMLHESETCTEAAAPDHDDEDVRQRPFENLRDMLRQR